MFERSERLAKVGGEAGIRTLGRAFRPYNGLANRLLQPLGHLTALVQVYRTQALTRTFSTTKEPRRPAFKPSPLTLSTTTPVLCIVPLVHHLGTGDGAQFRAQFARSRLNPFKMRK